MCYIKKAFLKISQNSHESICTRVSFLVKCQNEASKFIKKETVAPFFYRAPPVAASEEPLD